MGGGDVNKTYMAELGVGWRGTPRPGMCPLVRGCKPHEHEEVKGGLLPRLASGHASNGSHLLGLCRSYPRASVFLEPTGCSERKWVGRAEVTIPWFLASLCPGAEPISRSIGWRSYIGGTGRHPIGKGLFPKLKPLVVHTEDRPCSMPITSTASSWSILGHSISAGQLLA